MRILRRYILGEVTSHALIGTGIFTFVIFMKACGVSLSKFLRVLSIFFVGAWVLALLNSIYLAPKSQQALSHLQERLKGSQVSFEIQPRVFYEGFPKKVLYVHDV